MPVGSGGVTTLTNGNYVTRTATWDNGAVVDVGAVTWGNGTVGRVGAVAITNSLVGSVTDDGLGANTIAALSNGHYVVNWMFWNNAAVVNTGGCNLVQWYSSSLSLLTVSQPFRLCIGSGWLLQ